MKFDEAVDWLKCFASCTEYLTPSKQKNYYNCIYCESGTGRHGTGAMEYHEDTNTVYCHKCDNDGTRKQASSIDVYMKVYNVSFSEAVRRMADEYKLIIDEDEPTTSHKAQKTPETSPTVNNTTEQQNSVNDDSTASKRQNTPYLYRDDCLRWAANIGKTNYLIEQGITPETLATFKVGYIPETNQVVFPYDTKFSYWIKRKAVKNDKQYRKPKADEAGPEPLYNAAALYEPGPTFIVEGALDALSLYQCGARNVAAIIGTGETALIDNIKQKPPSAPLILWLDNDPPDKNGRRPGQESQARMAKALDEIGQVYINASYNLDLYGLDHGDPNDLLQANAEQLAKDVAENIRRAEYAQNVGVEMTSFLRSVYSRQYEPIPTGFSEIDKLLSGGFVRQSLVVLSGATGSGKTILMTMALEEMARQGIPAIYFNLEMSSQQLIARSLSRSVYRKYGWTTTALQVLQGYRQDEKTREYVTAAALEYSRTIGKTLKYNPLETSDLDAILDYINTAGKDTTEHGRQAPNICIDYLHLLTTSTREDNTEIIKRAVASFKQYAIKYNAIVFLISAQSRIASDSKKPILGAARDSSAVEYSADVMMQLVNEDENDPDKLKLYVTKSRFGKSSLSEGLEFEKLGNVSYLNQVGEWRQLTLDDKPPTENNSTSSAGKKKRNGTGKQDIKIR